MDEVLQKVKLQIETAKSEANPKKPFKNPSKPKASPQPDPIPSKSPKKKSVGTFGTTPRTLFPNKPSTVDYISSPDVPKTIPGGFISKLPRPTVNPAPDPVNPLNPNYNISKKKTPAPIISPKPFIPDPTPAKNSKIQMPKYKVSEEIDQILHSVSTADSEFEDFFKVKQQWTETLQQNIQLNPNLNQIIFPAPSALYSQNPQKTKTEKNPGPGTYLLNYEFVERANKGVKFSKEPRMPEKKAVEELPLFPNYDLVLKAPAGFKYVQDSLKTEQQLAKEAEEEEREAIKSIIYKMTNLDLPESQKQRVLGGVISPYVDIPTRFTNERLGPGKYFPNFESIEPDVPGYVAYKDPIFEEPVPRIVYPGPGFYSKDTELDVIGGFIPESPRSKSPLHDRRPPLHPNYDFNKPKVPSAIIQPEGLQLSDEPDQLGPGKYTPSYKLVEKRTDIDVLPFVQTKEKPAETDDRLPLFINDSQTKPKIPSFLYKDPTNIAPPHLPDSYFTPEQWKFYDANDEFKFDRPPQISFASTAFEDFPEYEKERKVLMRINQKLRGEWETPAVGSYDPEPIKDRAPMFDFGKMTSRDPEYVNDLQDDDREGDVLMLEPYKQYKVPMLVNMEKSTGRDTAADEGEYETELLIEPKFDLVRKKVPMLVNMKKNQGRLEKIEEEDEQLLIEPNFDVARKRVVGLVNMEKQAGREIERLEDEDMVSIPAEEVKKVIRSGVDMKRTTGRPEESPFEDDVVLVNQPKTLPEKVKKNIPVPNFTKMTGREEPKEPELEREVATHKEAVVDHETLYKAVDPEPRHVNFERYTSRFQEITEDPSDVPFVNTQNKYK